MASELATFGAGCFWGVEEAFRQVPGVLATAVGYMGGTLANPTYEKVCTDKTGHAEVVQVTFDPSQVTYEKLLNVFWELHDPTQLNRQGPDVGAQYRSVIFTHSSDQQKIAEHSKAVLAQSGIHTLPIMTQVLRAETFWHAEDYHQQYFAKRGGGQCHI